ncbi:hypothetical protein [Pedobacter sp.]
MGRQRNAKRRRILQPEAAIKPEPNEKVRLWLVYVGMGLVTLLMVAIQFGSVLLSHFSSTASHAPQPAAFEDKK